MKQAIIAFLTVDILDSFLKLTPPLRTPGGNSIFVQSLPWPQRYLLSTAIHVATGTAIVAGFNMVYTLITLFAVTVLGHSPTAWPPVFNNPWDGHCLAEFWGKRWHQALRRTFMIFGGFPGQWLGQVLGFGKPLGMLFGTFIGSGLYHEFSAYTLGKGFDWRVPAFFLSHAFFVLGERIWRSVTGYRVRGPLGRVWVYFTIMVLGQGMSEWFSFL